MDEDAPAVDQQIHPADLDAAEADPDLRRVDDVAGWIAQDDRDRIQPRSLRGPCVDVRDRDAPRHRPFSRRLQRPVELYPPRGVLAGEPISRDVSIEERSVGPRGWPPRPARRLGLGDQRSPRPRNRRFHAIAGRRPSVDHADVDREIQRSGPQIVGQTGGRADVGQEHAPGGVQEDRSRDPAVPPLILVLDIGRVGPFHDAQGQDVRPRRGETGEVELRRQVGVLRDADLPAVERHDQDTLGRPDMEHDPLVHPGRWNLDLAFVDAGRVVGGNLGREARKRHLDVRVLGPVVEALHRPATRNVGPAPGWPGLGGRLAKQLEPPPAVELDPSCRIVVAQRVHRQPVQARELRGEPRPKPGQNGHDSSSQLWAGRYPRRSRA